MSESDKRAFRATVHVVGTVALCVLVCLGCDVSPERLQPFCLALAAGLRFAS